MWPYEEDDHMEIGDSGWVPVKEGGFINKYNGHTMDENGKEFNEDGLLIFDPDNE